MIDATKSATSVATLAAEAAQSSAAVRFVRSASALTHGADPTMPAAMTRIRSGFRNHCTVYGVGSAAPSPAIACRYPTADVSVGARKNTHPIITTSIV